MFVAFQKETSTFGTMPMPVIHNAEPVLFILNPDNLSP
jgi:hypothetical protein